MSIHIDKIYELTASAILTPANLLKNIKLENYNEIKYYKENNELICEMTSTEEEELVKYIYQFDLSDKLNRATILFEEEEIEIFNREKELRISIEEYTRIDSKKII